MVVVSNSSNLIDSLFQWKKMIFSSNNLRINSPENSPIISISREVEAIDPLIFLSVMEETNQVSFYWQNKRKQEALVAIGAVQILNLNSDQSVHCQSDHQRFAQCREFIVSQQQNIDYQQDNFAQEHTYFFSYFSFFNKNNCQNNFPSSSIFLPYIQLVKKREKYVLTINTYENIEAIQEYIDSHNVSEELTSSYQQQQNAQADSCSHHYQIDEQQYQTFLDKVNQGLEAIATQKLTKIVVAHALEVNSKDNFNIIKSLQNLRNNHPDCYIFSIGNTEQEYFLGASPERLLSITKNQLVSDALAGSAPRGKQKQQDQIIGKQLLNGEKEKREHQVVSDFICQQLQKMNLTPKKASLQLLKLSNIQHLWTPIHAQMNNGIHPLEIVSHLHPTPAVAGEPMEVACREIEKSENFERSLYASPIGWINLNGDCEFIVGIRSALIKQNQAILYAGAGIVAGSHPDQNPYRIFAAGT